MIKFSAANSTQNRTDSPQIATAPWDGKRT
jgi:hypothetical protein